MSSLTESAVVQSKWELLVECYHGVITNVLPFLTHGDCGRLFFVSKQWREKLLGPSMRHFLLRRSVFYPYRGIRMIFYFPWNCCIEALSLMDNFIDKGWGGNLKNTLLNTESCNRWLLALYHESFDTALHLGMDACMLQNSCTIRNISFNSCSPNYIFACLEAPVIVQFMMRYNRQFSREGLNWSNIPVRKWRTAWDVVILLRRFRPDLIANQRHRVDPKSILRNLSESFRGHDAHDIHIKEYKQFESHLKMKYGLTLSAFRTYMNDNREHSQIALQEYNAFEKKFKPVKLLYEWE